MAGEVIADNIGFHKIALQVVITSHALGKNEEQMLAACEGLMLNHVSDGQRYNSPDPDAMTIEESTALVV